MVFEYINKTSRKTESWKGRIMSVTNHGTHYELMIHSRSSILVIFGKTTLGGFASMPDFGAGCHLVNLKNRYWNKEKLTAVLGKVDGLTVESALFSISDKINF